MVKVLIKNRIYKNYRCLTFFEYNFQGKSFVVQITKRVRTTTDDGRPLYPMKPIDIVYEDKEDIKNISKLTLCYLKDKDTYLIKVQYDGYEISIYSNEFVENSLKQGKKLLFKHYENDIDNTIDKYDFECEI
jgi:hypothetical protein